MCPKGAGKDATGTKCRDLRDQQDSDRYGGSLFLRLYNVVVSRLSPPVKRRVPIQGFVRPVLVPIENPIIDGPDASGMGPRIEDEYVEPPFLLGIGKKAMLAPLEKGSPTPCVSLQGKPPAQLVVAF